jgi:hypothetical protein
MKQQTHFWMSVARISGAIVVAALSWMVIRPPNAQAAPARHLLAQAAPPSTTITIEGVITSITGNTWVVGGVTITITPQTVITGYPVVGNVVQVVAEADGNNQLVALTIILIAKTATPGPSPTPSNTPTATFTPTAGPSPTPVATVAVTPVPYVVIVIVGPVEEININIIVVYGQRIKLRPDDPELAKLKIGDWVHVDGDFEQESDGTIIVVVVNIIIINPPPPVIILPPPPSGNGEGNGHHEDD